MRSHGIRNGGGVCVYMDEIVEALCLVELERRSCCFLRASVDVDLRDFVLSSSFGLVLVDFCLREWERERIVD